MKKELKTFLKGLAMGSVDIVPGISGGTMALILKIYTKIIDELKLINLELLKNLLQFKFKKALAIIDWKFLLALLLGIITAIVGLAQAISFALHYYPTYLYSFFFGLIIISAILLLPKKSIKLKTIIFFIIGFAIAWIISDLSPASTPNTYLIVFLSGAIAICAMILPGISGSFILLLLGKYEFIISLLKNPLNTNNLLFIIIFAIGCLIGLISFVRLLGYLVKNYYQTTLMLLIGFMLGALNKIWPFKEALDTKIIDGHEVIISQKNIWPAINQELLIAIILAIAGITIGYYLGKIKQEKSK